MATENDDLSPPGLPMVGHKRPAAEQELRARGATALEGAAERELRKRNGSEDPNVLELDADGLARVVERHYGDDAPRVLERAAAVARERRSR